MKPNLKDVTLLCVDTTERAGKALLAFQKSSLQCDFGAYKFLTHSGEGDDIVHIPKLEGLQAYSNFCIREMVNHVDTSHVLLIQSDGYVLNADAWNDEFLKYDYIGAPWLPSGAVGNGGFSLRSRKLLRILATKNFGDSPHPEDNYICIRHRKELEGMGIRFAPTSVAQLFAFEGRSWNNGVEWSGIPSQWSGQFGFHSWLTPLPRHIPRPRIFHHTGDWGDVIYSLPTVKALGGGVMFLSDDNKFPYPRRSRERVTADWVNNISPLLMEQPYIERVHYTHGLPFSTDYDLNKFRLPWSKTGPDSLAPIWRLHLKAFGVDYPEDKPWLSVRNPISIADRPIVVSRSPRYRNLHFPVIHLAREYGDKMLFVGNEREFAGFHNLMAAVGKKAEWYRTENLLELARIIAGAKVFIGNQSAPMAIAMGLCKNVIQECWQGNPNCLFRRPNVIYWGISSTDDYLKIPEGWLQ